MREIVKKIYLNVVPIILRKKLSIIRNYNNLNDLRKEIIKYYSRLPENQITEEQYQVVEYLKKNPISEFPYIFQEKYNPMKVEVFLDEKIGLHYVFQNKKRLYFKRSWTKNIIKDKYNFLQIEQDINSPHRYLTDEFNINYNDVIVDIGVAEGNFALSVIEKASKMYLFETDKEWIEALKATFAPWSEKVEIINKFVSDKNDEKNVTLDYFFEKKQEINFIKIDVDGAETVLLKGCDKILSDKKSLKVALCTYHKQDDEVNFANLLKNKGFDIVYSKGYMIFIYDNEIKAPYLRRGLIRATK